ncbi:hypothetical protein JKP88DRAFT_206340 [Tribonema minus]|uniref:Uncharacterized protein n=1 Tax=Tribonema minus TaxID=303371 RepID=A0A835Z903_9STRA|nr:hypothetical protein JKP88DRAFT_206340 [Tribonema minus]
MLTILYLLRLRLPALDGGLAVGGGGGGAAAVRRHAAAAPPVHFVRAGAARLLTHLIMVPGHAITMGDGLAAAPETDEAWHLLDYQREHDVGITFVDHIQGGVTLAAADTAALLLFSGGQTRADAGPKSEGFSYFAVAEANSWWGQPQVRGRAASEEFARDSFENLLFSVARFREITGHYPEKITIVGYDFKRDRYVNQHAAALRYPARAVSYLGIAPRGARFDTAGATAGEAAHAALPFKTDPYGCGSPVLADKRRDRNPYAREPPYPLTAPEMAELLRWCGPGIYAGALPWDPPAAEGGKEEGAGGKAAAAA